MSRGVAHIDIARIANVLARVPQNYAGWMSRSEQALVANVRSEGRRSQYLAGHWLTRELLGRASGDTPSQWRLLERKSQPPQVHGHGDALKVSISHTRDWIAAAVATVAIGIDLEQRPRRLDPAIEPLLRNADEAPGSLSPDELLQRWVAKEAWIKRNIDSALPARLKSLQLRATLREHADVFIDSNAAFHFGLAITPDCSVQRQCEVVLIPGVGFGITELEAQVA